MLPISTNILLALATLWATAALYVDLRDPIQRVTAPILYVVMVTATVWIAPLFLGEPRLWLRSVFGFAAFSAVLVWWLSIKPTNERTWQADVAQTAWAELDGDLVTIHNYRNCDYRSEFDYSCRWVDKQIRLSDIRGLDVFIVYWGSDWIAHPIASFQIGEDDHVAFSIETRKEEHQRFATIRGFFKNYALIYTVAPETDLVRLRTNFRKGAKGQGEDVYIYRTIAGPDWSRLLFLAYIYRINELRDHPAWYNAVTNNCTTNIFTERAAADNFVRVPTTPLKKLLNKFDWRILLNGKGDKMEFQRGDLVTGGLSFEDLKRQAYINPVARSLEDSDGFSERIRSGRIGF
ncbi:MAG: DUF4105 domain-containing protein [Candidatus Acidiferrum sp.]